EVRGGEAGQDGGAPAQVAAEQGGVEVLVLHASAELEELEVRVGGQRQALARLHGPLGPELLRDRDARREPGRIEDLQVAGVDRRAVAATQGMTAQRDGEGAAGGQG